MTEHLKEPWDAMPWGDGTSTAGSENIVSLATDVVIAVNVMEEEADRIVACVNALAGIDDPEAFMRDVWSAANDKSHKARSDYMDAVREHLKGGE